MMRYLLLASTLMFGLVPEMSLAQSAGGGLVIYGNDKCPTNKNGEEIVVCARRPEAERFRIPKELRTGGKFAESESWTHRSASTLNVGATGAGSCSNVGPGGFTGCAQQDYNAWRQQKKADKAEIKAIP